MRFYIGTAERILDVDPPKTEIPVSYASYGESGSYIGGGAWLYRSAFGAKQAVFSWGRGRGTDADALESLLFGRYGGGPIYYCDPFARNILPHYLSVPSSGVPDGSPSAGSKLPTWDRFAGVQDAGAVPQNAFDLPVRATRLTLRSDGYRNTFRFVVPDDASVAVSVKGDPDTPVRFVLDWGDVRTEIEVSDETAPLWNTVVDNVGQGRMASLRVEGDGEVVLYGLMVHLSNIHATVGSVTEEMPAFEIGRGQAGCSPADDELTKTLYTLGASWEQEGYSMTLLETELFN